MKALRQALKAAGLPSDPEQVVGKMFMFTAAETAHHRTVSGDKIVAAGIHVVGAVTGIALTNQNLCLFPAQLEIGGGVVQRFRWRNLEEGWRAEMMWYSCEPNYGYAAGHLKVLKQPSTLAVS